MSYDLMIFKADSAPRTRDEFMKWYDKQTEWQEEHNYDDPSICSKEMKNWFIEMIKTFPALNGPFAKDDPDNYFVTDYSIGKEIIYAAFSWSVAEKAYEFMKEVANKHKVGFFDASADDGDIIFPHSGESIYNPDKLSSIEQIKKSAKPGQESSSIKDIIFGKFYEQLEKSNDTEPNDKKDNWWTMIFKKNKNR